MIVSSTTVSGLVWDCRGNPDDPPVILLEGYGGQMIGWRDGFCDRLVQRGLRVLRMDNRDIGLSRRHTAAPDYEIADMAADVVEVLGDAGIERVTVVGQSMGGMIAQHVALNHPERTRGLVLFYTTPSLEDLAPDALDPTPPQPTARNDAVEAFLALDRTTTSPAYGYDEVAKRDLAGRMFDRDPRRDGLPRQRAAIARMPDLTARLTRLALPVAVIHGRDDALISPRAACRISDAVPHAEVHLYPGMGHEVAPALWDDFAAIIHRAATASPVSTASSTNETTTTPTD